MRIEERLAGDVTVLELSGRLVVADGDRALREAVVWLLARGRNRIVLNLREVSCLDCGGLGILVDAWSRAARSGGMLALLNPVPRVRRLLEISGLTSVIAICGPECDVLGRLVGPTPGPGGCVV